MITNIEELADHVTYNFDRKHHTVEDAKRLISKSLFKYTSCGISFFTPSKDIIAVAGYCEGSDRDHVKYELTFPFTSKEFDGCVSEADKDGCETWEATHGCEKCHPQGTCVEWGIEFAAGEVGAPINPECKHCEGEGIIL